MSCLSRLSSAPRRGRCFAGWPVIRSACFRPAASRHRCGDGIAPQLGVSLLDRGIQWQLTDAGMPCNQDVVNGMLAGRGKAMWRRQRRFPRPRVFQWSRLKRGQRRVRLIPLPWTYVVAVMRGHQAPRKGKAPDSAGASCRILPQRSDSDHPAIFLGDNHNRRTGRQAILEVGAAGRRVLKRRVTFKAGEVLGAIGAWVLDGKEEGL